jgi:predicted transcriptional regulator of viral defense system
MDFGRLLDLLGNEPLFTSSLLLAGNVDPQTVRLQLSRWKADGRIYQLRRGLYSLAPPYQKIKPHPFVIANHLAPASYVSCQSALAHYGLIPEFVPVTVSVTTARPARRLTPLGSYEFRHIKPTWLYGYRLEPLGGGQQAFLATPEKALLDLVYLQPGGDSPAFLNELRLQNLDRLNSAELTRLADEAGMPKIRRTAAVVSRLIQDKAGEFVTL